MFSTEVLSSMLSALRTTIDSGGAAAKLRLYDGTKPPIGGTPAGTIQAEIPLAYPCGSVSGTTLTLSGPIESLRIGSQDVAWGRLVKSDDTFVLDLNVGIADSGAHIQLDSLSGYPGGTITLTAATLSF